jgi:hypothetical protein
VRTPALLIIALGCRGYEIIRKFGQMGSNQPATFLDWRNRLIPLPEVASSRFPWFRLLSEREEDIAATQQLTADHVVVVSSTHRHATASDSDGEY